MVTTMYNNYCKTDYVLDSIRVGNRTQSNSHGSFLVRLCSIMELIEPNRTSISLRFDRVRLVTSGYVYLVRQQRANKNVKVRILIGWPFVN